MRLAKVQSPEEAFYYCESSNFVLADAIKQFKEDTAMDGIATPK